MKTSLTFVIFVTFVVSILSSCSFMAPTIYKKDSSGNAPARSFWDQKVRVTGVGITLISPWGPMTLGYVNWERNTDQQTNAAIVQAIAVLAAQGFTVTPPAKTAATPPPAPSKIEGPPKPAVKPAEPGVKKEGAPL